MARLMIADVGGGEGSDVSVASVSLCSLFVEVDGSLRGRRDGGE